MPRPRSAWPGALAALAVLAAGVLLAFAQGRYSISPEQLVRAAWALLSAQPSGLPANVETVIWQIRGPRVLAALGVGAALSVAGTAFQGLFRNPLVSPDILGASAGAALGAVLGIFFSLGIFGIQAAAFAGGLAGGGAGLSARLFDARRRPDPDAAPHRRGGGLAPGRGHWPGEVPRRPVQPAPGDDVLAARQPVGGLDQGHGAAAAAGGRGHRGAAGTALEAQRDVAAGRGGALARCRDPAAARRHRRCGDAGHCRERGRRRHRRLDRPRRAASRAAAGGAFVPAAAANGGGSRRRIPGGDRHLGAHAGFGGDTARDSHRDRGNPVLHRTVAQCTAPGGVSTDAAGKRSRDRLPGTPRGQRLRRSSCGPARCSHCLAPTAEERRHC